MLYNLVTLQEMFKKGLNFYASLNVLLAENLNLNGSQWHATNKLLERFTRTYQRPQFNLGVSETFVIQKPFCKLLRFGEVDTSKSNVLLVAPLSGHYATLLRGTVKEFLPDHNVYITDWQDAGLVSPKIGRFGIETYIDYIRDFFEYFNSDVHVIAVCQPSVPVLAATAYNSEHHEAVPKSLVLMGGPIDTRINPTEVNTFAEKHPMNWFKRNVIHFVPFGKQGFGRRVYPGFLQLAGFMAMNMDRHVEAHRDYFNHLIEGDGDSASQHEDFYDEYMAVMDLDERFYLDTIKRVFKEHHLPKGIFEYRHEHIRPEMIKDTALLTIEGERDDITGVGQTEAAHALCPNVPKRAHYVQQGVGHYGVFNGRRFRENIAPMIKDFFK